jgi:Fe-Mn family superoxide dismutase
VLTQDLVIKPATGHVVSGSMRDLITLVESKSKVDLELNKLPYARDELAPVMSKATIDYHYATLAKSYVTRYNAGEGDSDFNEAGAYLHNIFFPQLMPPKGANNPTGSAKALIEKKYGSYKQFQEEIKTTAMSIQGSGWVYMSRTGEIKTIRNHQVRKDIALLIDWWEHAWALDYQADKAKYLNNIWRIINWDVVNQRL